MLGLASGCASIAHFDNTPTGAEEFLKDKSYLETHYTDIPKYDRVFASARNSPTLSELKDKWGEPNEQHKQWAGYAVGVMGEIGLVVSGYLAVPYAAAVNVMLPFPQETYVWEKGNYTITAFGVRGAMSRYEKRIHSWNWQEKNQPASSVAVTP